MRRYWNRLPLFERIYDKSEEGYRSVRDRPGKSGDRKDQRCLSESDLCKTADYHDLVVLKDRTEKYIEINSGFDKMRIQFDFNPM